ncbi:MAG TPA: hypothetical protein VH438_18725 [Gemmatimonadales bacterium]|jgi:hypothetical protein
MSVSRFVAALLVSGLATFPLHAQSHMSSGGGLRDLIPELFQFGDCGEPLCLNSNVNAATGHGSHYIGSTVQGTDNLIGFLSGAIAAAVSSFPVSTATSAVTFRFEGGRPVREIRSAGPIFGERVQTLGKGRLLLGVNLTAISFNSVRGVPLDNVTFNFTHQNTSRGSFFPQDSALGSPAFENDVIAVNTSINFNLQTALVFLTYGLSDRIDLGVELPLVHSDLNGGSIAHVTPFTNPTPHFFGTSANPSLLAGSSIDGSATGIGDVGARLKVNLGGSDRGAFGILVDGRFPTGNEDDFQGSGEYAVRGLGIVSGRFGNFSPHLNAGYLWRSGKSLTDAVLATAGFDQLMAPWATLAVDLITQWQVGTNPLVLPGTVTFTTPYLRHVQPTNIPDRDDDLIDGSVGFKFLIGNQLILVTNALVPLNSGGMRANWAGTIGIERTF